MKKGTKFREERKNDLVSVGGQNGWALPRVEGCQLLLIQDHHGVKEKNRVY